MKDDCVLNLHEKCDSEQELKKVYSIKMYNLEELLIMLKCYTEKNVPFIDYPTHFDLLMLKATTNSLDKVLFQLIELVGH